MLEVPCIYVSTSRSWVADRRKIVGSTSMGIDAAARWKCFNGVASPAASLSGRCIQIHLDPSRSLRKKRVLESADQAGAQSIVLPSVTCRQECRDIGRLP